MPISENEEELEDDALDLDDEHHKYVVFSDAED